MDKTRYTDSHEHPLSWFKPAYEDIPVEQENYTLELNKGLYTFIQGIEIKSGYQKIKYIYYAPTGKILAVESVPVLYDGAKGDKGENGAQGSAYKNIGHDDIGTGIRTPWADGDTYLNAVNGYLYSYDAATKHWNKIPSYADSRYNQAINDMIALSNNSGYDAEFLNVINLWVRNLTAQTALIKQLFSKKMTLQEGGIFKSANYNGTANGGLDIDSIPEGENIILDKNGTVGFAHDANGNSDIVDLNISGKIVSKNGFFLPSRPALHIQNTVSNPSHYDPINPGDLSLESFVENFLQDIKFSGHEYQATFIICKGSLDIDGDATHYGQIDGVRVSYIAESAIGGYIDINFTITEFMHDPGDYIYRNGTFLLRKFLTQNRIDLFCDYQDGPMTIYIDLMQEKFRISLNLFY